MTPDWWQLGLQLGLMPGTLDGFKSNPERDSVEMKFERMLERWINKGEDEYRTWDALAKAVDRSGNKAVGNKVRKLKHYREGSKGKSESPGMLLDYCK